MKWFEHHTNDRDLSHVKIIKSKFGAEGYGIFMSLLEVIGENVQDNNLDEWGCVSDIHDIDSLAVECGTNTVRLKEFLAFCDSKNIFQKKNNKLFCQLILERLDNYAKRVKRTKPRVKRVRTKSVLSSSQKEPSTTLHTQKQIHIHKENIKENFKSFESLTEPVLKDLAEELAVTYSDVEFTRKKMRDWLEAKGKRPYTNHKAALRNWITRGIEEGKIKQRPGKASSLADVVPD